jgi:uncharacterized protein (DUF1330 family)
VIADSVARSPARKVASKTAVVSRALAVQREIAGAGELCAPTNHANGGHEIVHCKKRSTCAPRPQYALRSRAWAAIHDREVSMTAYWINTFIDISDEAKLARYVELAGPAMRAAGGRFLARGEPAHVFEGGTALRTTLIEFDTVKAAVDAYNSSAYQEALRALGDGAHRDIRIIEAI